MEVGAKGKKHELLGDESAFCRLLDSVDAGMAVTVFVPALCRGLFCPGLDHPGFWIMGLGTLWETLGICCFLLSPDLPYVFQHLSAKAQRGPLSLCFGQKLHSSEGL